MSLYAIAGIRTENAMFLLVSVHGHRLVALLDSGSTHNFINADLLCRLHLSIAPHPTMQVLVANDDRVPCEGIARDVALAISTERSSPSAAMALAWVVLILFLASSSYVPWVLFSEISRICARLSHGAPGAFYGRA